MKKNFNFKEPITGNCTSTMSWSLSPARTLVAATLPTDAFILAIALFLPNAPCVFGLPSAELVVLDACLAPPVIFSLFLPFVAVTIVPRLISVKPAHSILVFKAILEWRSRIVWSYEAHPLSIAYHMVLFLLVWPSDHPDLHIIVIGHFLLRLQEFLGLFLSCVHVIRHIVIFDRSFEAVLVKLILRGSYICRLYLAQASRLVIHTHGQGV